MSRLVIYGCGGFGREMLTIARRETRTIVFADDIALEPVLGVDVIRPDEYPACRRGRHRHCRFRDPPPDRRATLSTVA